MISGNLHEADLHDSTVSVASESSSSCSQNYEVDNNGVPKIRRTINKLRSIKLVKFPSVRLRPRQSKIISDSLQLNQMEMSDASPNYMKTTTSSTAKNDNLLKSTVTLTRRSSFMLPKSFSRLPSTRFRRTLLRKSSGGSNKMKKSKSVKLSNRSAIDFSDAENAQFQASVHSCKSSSSNVDASNKSLKVITRVSSMRPVRMLKKMSSLRTNRSSMKKSSQSLERNTHKATCSSILKDSKFPNRFDIQSGEGISTTKVCPYRYCSLYGQQHSRRRALKSQRSVKLERKSSFTAKCYVKKVIRGRQVSSYKDASILETASSSKVRSSTRKIARTRADLNRENICDGDGDTISCSGSVTDGVHGELSAPLVYKLEDCQPGEFPAEESHAVPGEKEDSSEELDSSMIVLSATEKNDTAWSHEENSSMIVLGATEKNDTAWSHEEISETERIQHDANEDKISTSNLEVCRSDLEFIALVENSSTSAGSRTIDSTVSSVAISEQIEDKSTACKEKNGDDFPKMDTESDYNTHVVDKTQMGKQKHMGLWSLIYKHMSLGNAAENDVQASATETDKGEGEDADSCSGTNQSGSSDFSGIDHGFDEDNNHEKGSYIQFYQQNAIKLVKKALDKILSEIPDQSSDSGRTVNREFSEINCDGEELSISASFNSTKEDMALESEKVMLNADKTNGPEAEKIQPDIGRKSKQQTPNNWSNLKKIVVLNKFVKALDKVREFNPRKPRFLLPVRSDPKAKKIHLLHQTLEEKKKSEEWMLDYALQQVISTLAPAEKRKVALLVQAFESVAPLPDTGRSQSSNSDTSSHATPVESCIGSPYQKNAGKGEETRFEISLRKASFTNMRSDDNPHHVDGSWTKEEQGPDSCSELKELNMDFRCTDTALGSEFTAAELKENFGYLDLDNKDHYSIIKDDHRDSVNCCLVEDGETNITETTSPKLADLTNTSNDVQADREISDPEVHDPVLAFDDQHEIVSISNDILGEVSPSKVHDHDFGFNNQHDIANTTDNISGHGEVCASDVHCLDLGFNYHDIKYISNDQVSASEAHDIDLVNDDQQDISNTSNDLSNGEVSISEVGDLGFEYSYAHDVENASDDVHRNGEIAASEVNDLDLGFNDRHNVENTSKGVLANDEGFFEVHDLGLGFSDQHDAANTSNDFLANTGGSSSEVLLLDLGFNYQHFQSNPQISEGDQQSDDGQNQILKTSDSRTDGEVNSLAPVPELVENSSDVTKGEMLVNNMFPQQISPCEESRASAIDLTHEKQKNMGLWYLIYKHMVSGTTALLDESADEEEQGTRMIASHETNDTDAGHGDTGGQKVDFQKIEAIRMVEEAIDEIPLPDSQDDLPEDYPFTSDIISKEEHLKKQHGRVSVHKEVIKRKALDPKEPGLDLDDTTTVDRETNAFRVVMKTTQKPQKSWSNLKKMILLRRFVKALEKVKEFNPRKPRFLPMESEKEVEKVQLKHRDMEDRKNADEWMLDYALQQVVAKLTPARKRKVQLLVEAFETLIPTIES